MPTKESERSYRQWTFDHIIDIIMFSYMFNLLMVGLNVDNWDVVEYYTIITLVNPYL